MRLVFAILAVMVGLAAAACGNDSSDGNDSAAPTTTAVTTTTVAPLTAAEFRKQVSAICMTGDASIEAKVQAQLQKGEPTADVARQLIRTVVIPTVEQEIVQAEALNGPADVEQGLARMLAAANQELDQLRDTAAGTNPLSAFLGDPFAKAHAIAAENGFTGCRYVPE